MAKSLEALTGRLDEASWPRVLCPDCLEGALVLQTTTPCPDVVSRAHIELVRRNFEAPDELTGTFTGSLQCDNTSCGRIAVIAGDWVYGWAFDEIRERDVLVDFFVLRYINPAPRLLFSPARTPAKVVASIATASSVLWMSPDLAATQLRLAVEQLLSARGVRRTTLTTKKKRRRLSTQERLGIFAGTHPEVVHALEAVKWIGNSGTHETGLTVDDVVKGAQFLELALRGLYDASEAKLVAEAKDINRRRGLPRSR